MAEIAASGGGHP